MENILHNVIKIEVGPIEKLTVGEGSKTHTRDIRFETASGEKLNIDCFAESREALQIEIEETKKI